MTQAEAPIRDISRDNLSYTMIEFYTLIAMTCLYGGFLGMVAVNQNLANMSSKGKRVSVSPVSKGKMIFGSVLAGYITQIIGVALLFLYTIGVLKVDYGEPSAAGHTVDAVRLPGGIVAGDRDCGIDQIQ